MVRELKGFVVLGLLGSWVRWIGIGAYFIGFLYPSFSLEMDIS